MTADQSPWKELKHLTVYVHIICVHHRNTSPEKLWVEDHLLWLHIFYNHFKSQKNLHSKA